jgi:hypothetical protein
MTLYLQDNKEARTSKWGLKAITEREAKDFLAEGDVANAVKVSTPLILNTWTKQTSTMRTTTKLTGKLKATTHRSRLIESSLGLLPTSSYIHARPFIIPTRAG